MYKFTFDKSFDIITHLKDNNNQDLVVCYQDINGNSGVICDSGWFSKSETLDSIKYIEDWEENEEPEEPGDRIVVYDFDTIDTLYVLAIDYDGAINRQHTKQSISKLFKTSKERVKIECEIRNTTPLIPIFDTKWNSDKPIWHVCNIQKNKLNEVFSIVCSPIDDFLTFEECYNSIPGFSFLCDR